MPNSIGRVCTSNVEWINVVQKALEVPPSQFMLGSRAGGDDAGEDLDDDTQICSCHVRPSCNC